MTILFIFSLFLTILNVHEEMKNGKKKIFLLIPRKKEWRKKSMTWIQIHINNESSYSFTCLTQHNFHFCYVEWLLNIFFLFFHIQYRVWPISFNVENKGPKGCFISTFFTFHLTFLWIFFHSLYSRVGGLGGVSRQEPICIYKLVISHTFWITDWSKKKNSLYQLLTFIRHKS